MFNCSSILVDLRATALSPEQSADFISQAASGMS
jgi:hypothetical protein